jgi:hypothetical protein
VSWCPDQSWSLFVGEVTEPYPRGEQLRAAPLVYAPASPENIRVGWRGLPGTDASAIDEEKAYYIDYRLQSHKSFIACL